MIDIGNVYIAGHSGMVGSAVKRKLSSSTLFKSKIITCNRSSLDLRREVDVCNFFSSAKPDTVIVCAAKVGGISANINYPTEFLLDNLQIQNSIFQASLKYNVRNICFLGSSCMYPSGMSRPIKEDDLLAGPFETTNEGYALAKTAGLRLGQMIRRQYGINAYTIIPNNSYGPGDNYDPKFSHVIPSLISKFRIAISNHHDSITCLGNGQPLRDFLYIDDLADSILWSLCNINIHSKYDVFNVGTGREVSIKFLVNYLAELMNFNGKILWDQDKPNGMSRKLLDTSRINELGWYSQVSLEHGLKYTIKYL